MTVKTKVFRWWLENDVDQQAAADAAMFKRPAFKSLRYNSY